MILLFLLAYAREIVTLYLTQFVIDYDNHSQPDLYTLARIAEVLDADIHRLIYHTKEE